MSGGLIHKISNNELIANRDKKLYSDDEKKYIELISIKHDSIVEPIGSFTYKIQKYYSDIDINQTIKIRNNDFKKIAKHFQEIAMDIMNSKYAYFSDLKLGVDPRYTDDRRKVRWTLQEIIRGEKTLQGNIKLRLEDALQMEAPIKLDIIGFMNDRFVEASTFFILEKENEDGTTEFVNIPNDFFERFKEELKREVKKYAYTEPYKLFKSVKRMWSLARVNKDFKMLKRLEPLINSNISLLGQINADIETIEILFNKLRSVPLKDIITTINSIGKRISTITDVYLSEGIIIDYLERIKEMLTKNIGSQEDIKRELMDMHDYILEIMNMETYEYMKKNKLYPIDKEYLPKNTEK